MKTLSRSLKTIRQINVRLIIIIVHDFCITFYPSTGCDCTIGLLIVYIHSTGVPIMGTVTQMATFRGGVNKKLWRSMKYHITKLLC